MHRSLLLFLVLLISACKQHENPFLKLFNESTLSVQEFTINVAKDTSIITNDGIQVAISANSIQSNSSQITLQIKEALDVKEMIQSGLFTMSGDALLSSDGMFYISTKEKTTLVKPLKIKVPKNTSDKDEMQLYRGEEKDKRINWIEPTKISALIKDSSLVSGERIFKSNCSSCHSIDKLLIGPPLGRLPNIRTRDWLYSFTNDNATLRASGDRLACCVYNEFGRVDMPRYHFNQNELNALYNYIETEMNYKGYSRDYAPYRGCDSCDFYKHKLDSLEQRRDSLIRNNGKKVRLKQFNPTTSSVVSASVANIAASTKVSAAIGNAEYYQLDINAYGWYNIDMLVKQRIGLEDSYLAVRVMVPVKVSVSVMLVVPSLKLFVMGGQLDNHLDYGFDERNGQIQLPQGVQAYVMGYTEEAGKIYFGITGFITGPSQNPQLRIAESNEKSISGIIQSLSMDEFSFKIQKARNADSIKSVDTLINEIYRKVRNCDCGSDSSSYEYNSDVSFRNPLQ